MLPEAPPRSHTLLITGIAVLVAAALVATWWFTREDARAPGTENTADSSEPSGLGAEIYSEGEAGAAVPETNPFNDSYQNPFE